MGCSLCYLFCCFPRGGCVWFTMEVGLFNWFKIGLQKVALYVWRGVFECGLWLWGGFKVLMSGWGQVFWPRFR